MATHLDMGEVGEKLAAAHLKKQGYKILDTNVVLRQGELDIVAKDKKCICFVEVKTRGSAAKGRPEEAVHKSKQAKLIALGQSCLKQKGWLPCKFRFDVVGILLNKDKPKQSEIRLIKGAFGGPEEA